jgi:UDP-glucose 4-epimerase
MKKIFVTGGAGYIGSHCIVKLLEEGYIPFIYDDFSNSSPEVLSRIQKITGEKVGYFKGDIRDYENLTRKLQYFTPDAVIHFAGKKSVSESVTNPILYYSVNVGGSISLLNAMENCGVRNLIFSSTATVYGNAKNEPYSEVDPVSPINNYGKSKLIAENIFRETAKAHKNWKFLILRYFNPVGAHPSGLLGEDPSGIPANLMPYITQVAIGKRKELRVFGGGYETRDGTGARDYIHIQDLASGHLAALKSLGKIEDGFDIFNLGTGNNTTVLELVKAFEKVNNVQIPFEIVEPRAGDSAICYAKVDKASKILNWKAEYSVEDMCKDAWNWQQSNPNGY